MANPPTAFPLPRPFDPSARRPYYAQLTRGDSIADMLQTGEEVTTYSVDLTSDAMLAGLTLMSSIDKAPRYSNQVFSFWLDKIDPLKRASSVFNDKGADFGIEISYDTNLGNADQFTVLVKVVNR